MTIFPLQLMFFNRPSARLLCLLLSGLLFAACTSHPEILLGDQLSAQGRWDEAVTAYRQAAKKEPFNKTLQQRLELAKAKAAEDHYASGRDHLIATRIPEALQEFKAALGLDPSRSEHHTALADVLRLKNAKDHLQSADKLHGLGRFDEALTAYERAVELDPALEKALEGITTITEKQQAAKALGGSTQPITLRFQNAKLKEVFEILARAGGINVLFDKEVRDEPVTIFIKDTPFDEALNLILTLNGLFTKRIGPDTLLVLPNTKPKQDQYQDLMIRTFYLSNAKAKEMVNLVRTMLESKRVYVNEQLNTLVVRDTPAKLHLAERIIQANDRREAEVELDLEVLEVNRTKSQQFGLTFAKKAGSAIVPSGSTGGISGDPTGFSFHALTSLSPAGYLFSIPSSILLDFFKQESDAKTLASPKLRVLNNKQASVNVGDKQPILLSTSNVLPGQAATGAVPTTSTVTSIEFKDTGVKLTVEPVIHLADEVTLKLKIEVTKIGDLVTLQASPEIKQFRFGTRSAETTLNLKSDESVVLAGLIQDEDRKSRVTVPGLGDIPVLGKLLSSTTDDTVTTEVVLTITPHIVRNVMTPSLDAQAFWSGTEAAYATEPLFLPVASSTSHGSPIKSSPGLSAKLNTSLPHEPTQTLNGGLPSSPSPLNSLHDSNMPVAQLQGQAPEGRSLPPHLKLQPAEVTGAIGQELQVEVTTDQLENISDSLLTIAFDPQGLELTRIMPGAVSISSNVMAGQLFLTMRPQEKALPGGAVLATLLFQAKAAGEFPVAIQRNAASSADAKPIAIGPERVLIRAHW